MDVDTFVDIIGLKRNGSSTSAGGNDLNGTPTRIIRLASIDPNYAGYGNPAVIFDGESGVSGKTFAVAGTYRPSANDRVLMIPVGTTYMIIDQVKNDPIAPIITAGPTSYYVPWQYVGQKGQPTFQNSWANFDGGFNFSPLRFMVDAKGKLRMQGLIANPTSNAANVIFTLPKAFWPEYQLDFKGSATTGGGVVGIRITPNGDVSTTGYNGTGSAGDISMDEIAFFPANTGIVWTPFGALLNSWVSVGAPWAPARYYVDFEGIVHLSGSIASGSTAKIVSLPAGTVPYGISNAYTCIASGGAARIDISATNGMSLAAFASNGGSNASVSLEGIEYENSTTSVFIHSIISSYVNSWSTYDVPTFDPIHFSKDSAGIVRMAGLVKSGTTGNAMFASLPSSYRSPYWVRAANIANNSICVVDMQTGITGPSVDAYGVGGSNAFVSLSGLRWFAGD